MRDEKYLIDKFTIDELFRRSWSYKNSKQFVKFFDFIAGFQHYSRYNTMLVYLQNEEVTFFGGKSFWQKKFNRTIKENARPYVILAPMSPVMLVYDIFETEGFCSPEEFLKRGLGALPFEVKGQIENKLYSGVEKLVGNYGIKLSYKPLSFFHGGYVTTIFSNKLEIVLKENASNEENIAVMVHELAHLLLGHTGHKEIKNSVTDKRIKITNRKLSRTVEELEAEAVSYLICYKLGLMTRGAEYIAGYIKSPSDLLEFSYEMVIKTADKIESTFIKI